MASIKGFQLKAIKETTGREGIGCIANMYLCGKKIGIYADYADGGEPHVDYISKDAEQEMGRVIVAYAKENPNEYIVNWYKNNPEQYQEALERFRRNHPYIPEEDITMETVSANSIEYIVNDYLNLLNTEKAFKKWIKKGYRAIAVKENNLTAYPSNWNDEKIKKESEKDGELYMSLDDFVIA